MALWHVSSTRFQQCTVRGIPRFCCEAEVLEIAHLKKEAGERTRQLSQRDPSWGMFSRLLLAVQNTQGFVLLDEAVF